MSEEPATNPMNVGKDLKDAFTMLPGDWGCLTQLFFDNLSTLLGVIFAIQDMTNFGVDRAEIDNLVWGRIVPGVGLTLLVGNVYYAWQAARLTNKYGRPYTAQPYGLNTPAAFSFVFNIMYPVYFSLVGSVGPSEAFRTAYKVALAANFVTGLVSTALSVFGPLLLRWVPPAALLVPIAGIGFAFLGGEQISHSLAAPIVGYNAIIWVFLGWYAGVRLGFGNYRLPEALQVIIVGVVLGWITGLNKGEDVESASDFVKWWGPDWSADELFADFDLVKDYLGIVIPLGISAVAGTLMCLVSAKNAGDPYPIRETMIADGIGTIISSFLGSPFGTVVYIGHPAHKRSGARSGYSLANGFIYFILSWFGILALIQSIVNQATIGPIVLFVGLMICEEALNFMSSRHYSAFIIGLFPSVYDWITNISSRAPLGGDESGNTNLSGQNSWYGVLAWKRGALLVSFCWVGILVYVIDRQWKKAAVWSGIASLFALFGIIHVPEAGFASFGDAVWEQCSSGTDCWDHAQQWKFFVAYIMLGATFLLVEVARTYGGDKMLLPPVEDNSAEEFKDWFKDAAVVVKGRTKSYRDELEEMHKKEKEQDDDDDAEEDAAADEETPAKEEKEPAAKEDDNVMTA